MGGEIPASLRKRMEAMLAAHPIFGILRPKIERLELDYCELRMPYRDEISNGFGQMLGGALATLADTAMALALATNFEGNMGFATADLTIHFFKPARTDVVAKARVVKKGRRINVGVVDVQDDAGDLLATVLTSFLLTSASFPKDSE
jgi:uncharacterized protein (TIGR00369 family)